MPGWLSWFGAQPAQPTPTPVKNWPWPPPIDTPDQTRDYCPECEPDTDPLTNLVHVVQCDRHRSSTAGSADILFSKLKTTHYKWQEAGGASNKAACDFIHRSKKETPHGRQRSD